MNFFQAFKSPQQFLQSMIGNSQVMQNPMAKNAIGRKIRKTESRGHMPKLWETK